MKCVERFKYERSKQYQREVDWEEAHKLWISEGFAEKFAEAYQERMRNEIIYLLIMGR